MMHGWDNLRPGDEAAILRGIAEGGVHGGPYHVEIDPIDRCNVACFFCGSADLHQGGVLRWDKLSPIVEDLIDGGLRSFRLAGGGEPLIYPDLEPLCDRMARAGIVLDNITTNGIQLHRWLPSIAKLPITQILFSLNYATPEDYGRFMQTAPEKFENVISNIHLMHDHLVTEGRRDETQIQTQFFIHRSTVESIPGMVELAKKLPVDSVTFKAIGFIPDEEVIQQDQLPRLRELIQHAADEIANDIPLPLDFALAGLQPFCEDVLERRHNVPAGGRHVDHNIEYCYIAWYSTTIQGSGDVHACCHLMPAPEIEPLGNVNRQRISDIWRGENYTQLRHEMRTAMLMQAKTPFQQRRFRCTVPACWEHDQCPLSHMMASQDFYQRAHQQLQGLRRKPITLAARYANRASRHVIEKAKPLLK
ncbi:MAG: radical SAM protein [Candidatus Sumerlaeaceae bacterium]